jgi:hypothetical protein
MKIMRKENKMRKQEPKAWLAIFKLCPPKDEKGNVLDVKECWECDDTDFLCVRAISDHAEYWLVYNKNDGVARIMNRAGKKMLGWSEPSPEIVNIWCEDYRFSKEMTKDAERYEKEAIEEQKKAQEEFEKSELAKKLKEKGINVQVSIDAGYNDPVGGGITTDLSDEQVKQALKEIKDEMLKGAKPVKNLKK